MKAQDIMSRDVVTVRPDDSILHAARLMLQKGYSGLPVVDASGSLVGILTEGDFLRRVETDTVRRRPHWLGFFMGSGRLAGEYTHAAGRRVHEVMTRDVYSVSEDAPLSDIVDMMERRHIKRLPVLRRQQVVGIVTRQNLLRAVIGSASAGTIGESDKAIRDRLLEELKKQPWAPLIIDPIVVDGKVKLVGTIVDDRQREALTVAAENIPGVKSVEDALIWIEPTSGMVIEPRAA